MEEFNIMVLESSGVGRRELISHFLDYNLLVPVYNSKVINVDGSQVTLEILDSSVFEQHSVTRDSSIRNAEGFILLYSIFDQESFLKIPEMITQIERVKDVDVANTVPMILVGNRPELGSSRVITEIEGENMAQSWGIPFVETSTVLNHNVNIDAPFYELAQQLVRSKMS